jgi:hypothetical protein
MSAAPIFEATVMSMADSTGPTVRIELIWGAAAIAAEIGVSTRRGFYLLERQEIPCKKVCGRWVADRAELHAFFRQERAPPSDAHPADVNDGGRPRSSR